MKSFKEFLYEKPIKFIKDKKGNYCPCGNYGKEDALPCIYTTKELIKYQKKIQQIK